jgi:hypothetical protein
MAPLTAVTTSVRAHAARHGMNPVDAARLISVMPRPLALPIRLDIRSVISKLAHADCDDMAALRAWRTSAGCAS